MNPCKKCGHTHKGDFCENAYCEICGLGGNLTFISCNFAKETNKQIEMYFRTVVQKQSEIKT